MSAASTTHTTCHLGHCNPTGAGAALFALGGGEAVAAASLAPDAELLACCTLARAIDDRTTAACDAVEHLASDDPRWEVTYQEARREMVTYHLMVERAAELPARTPEGLRAKAELALSYLAANDDPEIAVSLARDVAGRA